MTGKHLINISEVLVKDILSILLNIDSKGCGNLRVEGHVMRVLIVENNADLGFIWSRFLERQGLDVELATSQREAIELMRFDTFDALVLELVLPDGGAIAIADYATYRYPEIPIITITGGSFFSDGSIFEVIPNVHGLMRKPFRPDDLAALLEHCGTQSEQRRIARA